MNYPPYSKRQRGAALIVALLIFAVCAALAVGLRSEFDLFYRRQSNALLAEQAWAYLRGAEELAAQALQEDADQDLARQQQRDDLSEFWAVQAREPQPYPLDEGGWMVGWLTDLQGLFNLNSLAQAAPSEGENPQQPGTENIAPAQQQFIRLLLSLPDLDLGQDQARLITDSIADWIDTDNQARPNGAEDDYYYGLTPAYRAANQPLQSPTELLAVAYVTPEIYQALAPYVTVWPREPQPMNIHTAPVLLLRTINADGNLQPLGESEAAALAELREEQGFESKDALLADPLFADQPMEQMATLLGENSNYFLLTATVDLAGRESRLYSVLQRRERQITAIQRMTAPVTGAPVLAGDSPLAPAVIDTPEEESE